MGAIEELVDTALVGQHPKMRERCIVDCIVSVFDVRQGGGSSTGVWRAS